jgi:hypothetical protein
MFQHKPLHLLPSASSLSPGDVTPPSRVPTPLRQTPKSLRPYVYALMAFKHGRSFEAKPSAHRARRLSQLASKEGPFAPALTVCNFTFNRHPSISQTKGVDSLCWHFRRL